MTPRKPAAAVKKPAAAGGVKKPDTAPKNKGKQVEGVGEEHPVKLPKSAKNGNGTGTGKRPPSDGKDRGSESVEQPKRLVVSHAHHFNICPSCLHWITLHSFICLSARLTRQQKRRHPLPSSVIGSRKSNPERPVAKRPVSIALQRHRSLPVLPARPVPPLHSPVQLSPIISRSRMSAVLMTLSKSSKVTSKEASLNETKSKALKGNSLSRAPPKAKSVLRAR